jgi:membrane protease YdiL (CAAX protease family)
MPAARSPRLEAFVAPAMARPAIWRLLLGVLLAAAVWIAVTAALLAGGVRLGAGPRGILLLYLASFGGLALGTALAVRLLHRRPAMTLFGPGGFAPRAVAIGVAVVAGLALLSLATTFALAPPERQMPLATWMALVPLALPALLVQTGAEELLFRGYLLQALAARFRSPLVWRLVPALLFGALHWDRGAYGSDAWLAVAATTVVGLILVDVTVRTGNLSAAIGLHFANNVVAVLLVATPGPVGALGLYVLPVDGAYPLRPFLLADIASTVAAWGAWRLAAARRRRLHSRDRGSI